MALLYHQGIFFQTKIVFLYKIIWWSKISKENMRDDITLTRKAKLIGIFFRTLHGHLINLLPKKLSLLWTRIHLIFLLSRYFNKRRAHLILFSRCVP
jgi:hypothetical protein